MLWSREGVSCEGLKNVPWHTEYVRVGERMGSFLGASASPDLENIHCREQWREAISS